MDLTFYFLLLNVDVDRDYAAISYRETVYNISTDTFLVLYAEFNNSYTRIRRRLIRIPLIRYILLAAAFQRKTGQ